MDSLSRSKKDNNSHAAGNTVFRRDGRLKRMANTACSLSDQPPHGQCPPYKVASIADLPPNLKIFDFHMRPSGRGQALRQRLGGSASVLGWVKAGTDHH